MHCWQLRHFSGAQQRSRQTVPCCQFAIRAFIHHGWLAATPLPGHTTALQATVPICQFCHARVFIHHGWLLLLPLAGPKQAGVLQPAAADAAAGSRGCCSAVRYVCTHPSWMSAAGCPGGLGCCSLQQRPQFGGFVIQACTSIHYLTRGLMLQRSRRVAVYTRWCCCIMAQGQGGCCVMAQVSDAAFFCSGVCPASGSPTASVLLHHRSGRLLMLLSF